ncbi:MAG: hypothetical protein ACK5RL_01495 [Acidimicrobiales bacterium]
MTVTKRTHRSFVSYIDKSREYYAAHGYEQAYAWATHDKAPFTPLAKPLSESRIGLVTTSYFLPENFVYEVPADLPRLPNVAPRSELAQLNNEYLSWAKDETTTEDSESFIPFARMDEAVADGRLGAVSERFYCLPTQFSHRQTERRDAPRIIDWLREDEVDVALMVPL